MLVPGGAAVVTPDGKKVMGMGGRVGAGGSRDGLPSSFCSGAAAAARPALATRRAMVCLGVCGRLRARTGRRDGIVGVPGGGRKKTRRDQRGRTCDSLPAFDLTSPFHCFFFFFFFFFPAATRRRLSIFSSCAAHPLERHSRADSHSSRSLPRPRPRPRCVLLGRERAQERNCWSRRFVWRPRRAPVRAGFAPIRAHPYSQNCMRLVWGVCAGGCTTTCQHRDGGDDERVRARTHRPPPFPSPRPPPRGPRQAPPPPLLAHPDLTSDAQLAWIEKDAEANAHTRASPTPTQRRERTARQR